MELISRFPLEELIELGIHQIAVNMAFDGLFSLVEKPGWDTFKHGSRTWFVNPALVESWDTQIAFATNHDIVVTGTILVRQAPTPFGKLVTHPDSDPAGHYAMPNLTSQEGIGAYEAALSYIGRRYSAPGDPFGRVSNWTVHNEVNYGWEWTNMGQSPPMVYMDHYLRSMRLIHHVMRRENPHARVFISLTHHWNLPGAPSWKSYRVRDLLERLVLSSRTEGDFDWGIAYHPYPQSLMQADTWNDTNFTRDYETPMILIKNIEVLDRWVSEDRNRHINGTPRPVLLSEQGFHTPDYLENSQEIQAAAFAYTWDQLRPLKNIESFHNHRWIDPPAEGGLKLGLRTLPSQEHPFGEKKRA